MVEFSYLGNRSASRSLCSNCKGKRRLGLKPNDVKGSESSSNASTPGDESKEDVINKALFFPDTSLVTPSVRAEGGFNAIKGENYPYSVDYFMNHPSDGPLKELLSILLNTKSSIDLCMYVLSFPALADIIIQLQEKAVEIRIIVDGREDEALRSQVGRLSNRGIRIRQNEESYSILMHNKFAILDGSIVLTGSFNWTKTAVLLNYDNILVTSQSSIVNQYQGQFDHLWSQFKPYRAKNKS